MTPPNGRKMNGNKNSGGRSTIPNYNTIGNHGNDSAATKTDLLARPPTSGCGSSSCQCGDRCMCHLRSEVCECAASQIVSSCCDPRNNITGHHDSIRLMIDGMTCTQCVAAIANALRGPMPTATVSLGVVELPILPNDDDDGEALVEQATDIIESIGYEVVQVVRPTPNNPRAVWDGMHEQHERELQKSRRLFLASLFLTLPIAAWEWILSGFIHDVPVVFRRGEFVLTVDTLVLVVCATLVQFVCGYDFYKKTYYGSTGMHVLVAIATTTAYCYAIYNIIMPGDGSYMAAFDTATVLITFVLCGQYF
jgi:cation transport ATPase